MRNIEKNMEVSKNRNSLCLLERSMETTERMKTDLGRYFFRIMYVYLENNLYVWVKSQVLMNEFI